MSKTLKDRLDNWAPQPPPSVWQAVEEHLSQDEYIHLGKKLYDFNAPPPRAVWEGVAQSLEDGAPIIQLTPSRVWMRYAAGIAAAAFVFYFGMRAVQTNPAQPHPLQQSVALPNVIVPKAETAAAIPQSATDKLQAKARRNPIVYKSVVPQINGDILTLAQAAPAANNSRLYEVVSGNTPLVNEQHLERYIVVSTADEAAVKLPKKIYDLFRCEVPDKIACEERLDNLRMQAAAPSLLATADFSGLLEMVQRVK